MFFSKLLIPTLREFPSDADMISAKLMIKSGMIRKLASGIYEFLPLGLKVLRKIENIIRHEMSVIGGQEIVLPLVFPKSLWIETGRWDVYGKELFRLKDRKCVEFCLAPTAEEVIVDLVRKDVKSYRQLPIMLYQFGTKFRDEIRPRFGVMRSREFLMKDAYSFHVDELDLKKYYQIMFDAYKNIFVKCGLKFCVVESASGPIGGSLSHEFMILADNGETEVVWCKCGYSATSEKAECLRVEGCKGELYTMEEIFTPNTGGAIEDVVKFLGLSPRKLVKTLIYVADGNPVAVLVRGDHEVNETKLQTLLKVNEIILADEQTVTSIINTPIDFAGPVGLRNINVIADLSVVEILNAISGANKKDYHVKNINYKRDYDVNIVADIRKVVSGEICPRCKEEELKFLRGIEIGHIFKLNTRYSKPMNATYLDSRGKENFIFMGCYGLGVTRIVAAAIEQSHDDSGIIWPDNITPFEVLIVPLDYYDDRTKEVTEKIYRELSSKGLDVLVDDRDERPGVKFKDADLIGIPYRITIGKKNLTDGNVEFKTRRDSKSNVKLLKPEEVISRVFKIFKK
ncbi:MAG: proline--tRNA ligase [Endomicrobium sp.]|jgi:prolyl-tRNA synthetase|nr:proline--tRNA ligase [Endomicrobium sp.]